MLLSPCAVRQMQKLASKNRHMSAASIALKVAEVESQLVAAQTIHHTLQQVGLHIDYSKYTVSMESIQTPFNFSLFVILQPFAKII